jgi:ATP-dependent DNA ligase
MPSTFHFCLPTGAAAVPDHPVWLHEVEYDGYSLRLDREANRVRLFTRNGYDWTDRRPWIVEAALKNRHGVGGISNFNALHSRRHDEEVQLYSFDCLSLHGEDLRSRRYRYARPASPAY